jgi:hypothetical protein
MQMCAWGDIPNNGYSEARVNMYPVTATLKSTQSPGSGDPALNSPVTPTLVSLKPMPRGAVLCLDDWRALSLKNRFSLER